MNFNIDELEKTAKLPLVLEMCAEIRRLQAIETAARELRRYHIPFDCGEEIKCFYDENHKNKDQDFFDALAELDKVL